MEWYGIVGGRLVSLKPKSWLVNKTRKATPVNFNQTRDNSLDYP